MSSNNLLSTFDDNRMKTTFHQFISHEGVLMTTNHLRLAATEIGCHCNQLTGMIKGKQQQICAGLKRKQPVLWQYIGSVEDVAMILQDKKTGVRTHIHNRQEFFDYIGNSSSRAFSAALRGKPMKHFTIVAQPAYTTWHPFVDFQEM